MSFKLENSFGFVVGKTSKLMWNQLADNFNDNKISISPEQWTILAELNMEKGISQLEISRLTFRDPTTTSRIIKNLINQKMMVREKDPNDARGNLLYLTEYGEHIKELSIGIVEQTINCATEDIDSNDLEICMKVLKQITNKLA